MKMCLSPFLRVQRNELLVFVFCVVRLHVRDETAMTRSERDTARRSRCYARGMSAVGFDGGRRVGADPTLIIVHVPPDAYIRARRQI